MYLKECMTLFIKVVIGGVAVVGIWMIIMMAIAFIYYFVEEIIKKEEEGNT